MPARKQPTLREIVQKRDRPRDKGLDGAVLAKKAEGLTIKEIASALNLSDSGVRYIIDKKLTNKTEEELQQLLRTYKEAGDAAS